MADLAALAEYWSQYEGQTISGTVVCPRTDRTRDYTWTLSNVLWNGITDRVSFRFNGGDGAYQELLLTEEQLEHTPQQILAGLRQVIEQQLLDNFDATEFEDIGEAEL